MSDRIQQYDRIGSTYEDYSRTATCKRAERYSFLRMVGDVRGQRVLDLACGLGFYTRLIKQQGARQVIGVDISSEMIRLAMQQEQAEPLGITYQVGDALELPRLGPVDLVTAMHLFNYARSKDEMLRMFQRAYENLERGGRLVAYTVNPAFDLRRSNFATYGVQVTSEVPEGDHHVLQGVFVVNPSAPVTVYRWSASTYEAALTEAGFREFAWHPAEVSPEDLSQYGNEYWHAFYDNNVNIGLVCEK